MASVVSAVRDTVSISLFNRGLAGKIFEEVARSGAKVVIKNNVPEAVILSPQEYLKLMDELNDARLLAAAVRRMENFDPAKLISEEEMNRRLGISEADLQGSAEVEFE